MVLTVKASYVASTKYKTLEAKTNMDPPLVIWKMKAPEKQPLVRREAPDEVKAKEELITGFFGKKVWLKPNQYRSLSTLEHDLASIEPLRI